MRVFLVGMPLMLGGANSEAAHTALLWRRFGVEVTCLHFTKCHCGKPGEAPLDSNPWTDRLRAAGVDFVPIESGHLADVPGLAGSVLSSFCHQHTLHNWPEFASIGCKLIWSPCMTYTMSREEDAFRQVPASVIHFQSRFQAMELVAQYTAWGCREFRRIPGAFEPLPFNPRPRLPGEPFVIGRLARPCRTKWSPLLWDIIARVARRACPVEVLCQGWSTELTMHCGEPPIGAECLPANTLTATEFLSRCHAMICPNWSVKENWPRIGLESMSVGVPLVVDDAGGWPEMAGEAGVLCNTTEDYADALVKLATDETRRQDAIHHGLDRLDEICNPSAVYGHWVDCWRSIRSSECP